MTPLQYLPWDGSIALEDYFKYHPDMGAYRRQVISQLNTKALELANLVSIHVNDAQHASLAITRIKEAIMYANLGVTIDSIKDSDGKRI